MNLECLNDIITDDLAIHIDLTDLKSWDLNTGLTVFSMTKWNGAVSDNINLLDFGLTGFDNGRTNVMWSGESLTPKDTLFSMRRIGYNVINNPTIFETSGVTATTEYDIYPMSATSITGGSMNYFDLSGGYLQGFFKLKDYNYELLPARYNDGITIETLLYLYPESQGIFLMMGARAEDKYNPYFSGETITGVTTTGVTSSLDNYLDDILEKETIKTSFPSFEERTEITYYEMPSIDNIKNNVIAFELKEDKKLGIRYINNDGLLITTTSSAAITTTGFTWITISFTPNGRIDDPDLLECAPQRTGKLGIYVNGRAKWVIKEFPEFYFKAFNNDKEKQLGVPYSISWGGGSFGLKHSWHYDYQKYILYSGQDTTFIDENFFVEANPLPSECYTPPTGDTYLSGLTLSADSNTFYVLDPCDPNTQHPITVMRIENTGATATTYFIKYNHPVSVLSNRDYTVNLLLYDDEFFNRFATNKASILVYSDTVDVEIMDSIEYTKGQRQWKQLKSVFSTTDNSGQHFVNIGILIESSEEFNLDASLFVRDFTYTAADILVQDERKNDITIEQNFNTPFIGGIQKLRIYTKAFTTTEILHNILMEVQNNPGQNIVVTKGGRVIYS
mgnify:CR=1 FL=1